MWKDTEENNDKTETELSPRSYCSTSKVGQVHTTLTKMSVAAQSIETIDS